jgi:molecular chaperone GrpE
MSPEAEANAASSTTEQDPLAKLTAERDTIAAAKNEAQDLLLRTRAEFENFRKRVEREKMEIMDHAGMRVVETLLPVIDDLERALQVECSDKEYAKGMELIQGRLLETLKKVGLEPIEAMGATFDPNLHYAIDRVSGSDAEDQTILAEFQKGYNFKGKLLRPAMVKVAVA